MGWGENVEEMSFKEKRAIWKDSVDAVKFRKVFHKQTLFETARGALTKAQGAAKGIRGFARSISGGSPYAKMPKINLPRGY